MTQDDLKTLVRHEGETPRERSACGWRDRLISREDTDVAAWAHAVDIDGAREHYHKRSTELYYVLDGEGTVVLDGAEHPVRRGSLVHIPPGVVHGQRVACASSWSASPTSPMKTCSSPMRRDSLARSVIDRWRAPPPVASRPPDRNRRPGSADSRCRRSKRRRWGFPPWPSAPPAKPGPRPRRDRGSPRREGTASPDPTSPRGGPFLAADDG